MKGRQERCGPRTPKVSLAVSSSEHAGTTQAAAASAEVLLKNEPVDVPGAIQALEDSRNLMDEGNPEDVDLEILQLLRSCYCRIGEAAKTDEALETRQSVKQSRDFLRLASYYEEAGETTSAAGLQRLQPPASTCGLGSKNRRSLRVILTDSSTKSLGRPCFPKKLITRPLRLLWNPIPIAPECAAAAVWPDVRSRRSRPHRAWPAESCS